MRRFVQMEHIECHAVHTYIQGCTYVHAMWRCTVHSCTELYTPFSYTTFFMLLYVVGEIHVSMILLFVFCFLCMNLNDIHSIRHVRFAFCLLCC